MAEHTPFSSFKPGLTSITSKITLDSFLEVFRIQIMICKVRGGEILLSVALRNADFMFNL